MRKIYLLVSSAGAAATVTVSQPANGAFIPIVVNITANKSARINLTAFKTSLETRPTNTIANTGLRIQSTSAITAYYDIANSNNSWIKRRCSTIVINNKLFSYFRTIRPKYLTI